MEKLRKNVIGGSWIFSSLSREQKYIVICSIVLLVSFVCRKIYDDTHNLKNKKIHAKDATPWQRQCRLYFLNKLILLFVSVNISEKLLFIVCTSLGWLPVRTMEIVFFG